MEFEKKAPVWNAAGTEPPEELKNSGFTGGYKPPAEYFNWFMHGTFESLKELQAHCASGIKIYTSLEQIGVQNSALLKLSNILDKLPEYSTVITELSGDAFGMLPENVPCLLQVTHYPNGIFELKWTSATGNGANSNYDIFFAFATNDGKRPVWHRASRTYTDPAQIMFTPTRYEDFYDFAGGLAGKLPKNGRILYAVTEGNTEIYPASSGIFEAYAAEGTATILFKFVTDGGDVYMASRYLYTDGYSEAFKPWYRLAEDYGVPWPMTSHAGKFLRVNSSGEYELATVSVATTTDPGAGASVDYPNGTVIDVYE